MAAQDFIIIAQSDSVDYAKYSKLPLARLPLFKNLVYPRMVHYNGAFLSHVDLLSMLATGRSFSSSEPEQRSGLLNIWNFAGFTGIHLANYLYDYEINSVVINNFDAEWERLARACDENPSALLGLSTTFYLGWSEIKRIVTRIRASFPDIEIALGGAFVYESMRTEGAAAIAKAMHKYGVKYCLYGVNSESDLRDLILWRKKQKEGDPKVANMITAGDDTTSYAVSGEEWHPPHLGSSVAHYHELELPFLNNTIQLRASSGCCFSCAFCTYPQISKGFHPTAMDQLDQQLRSVKKIPSIKNLVFIDDTLNVPPKRFKTFLKTVARYDIDWFSFLRVQFVDEEIARLMRDSGCKAVYLGIESANNDILGNMNKKATKEEYLRGVELLRKYDISCMAAFIVGFPGETEESIQDNLDFIRNSGIDFYTLKEFFLIKGTRIDQDRDLYNLTGMHSNWEHSTMDSTQASEYKASMMQDIGDDCVFIDPDTSLWYLAYLYDQGFPIDVIASIQKKINRIVCSQMDGNIDDNHPEFGKIMSLLEPLK